MRKNFAKVQRNRRMLQLVLFGFLFAVLLNFSSPAKAAALVDVWRADSINLNDGDTVGTGISSSNRTANSAVGVPIFKRNVTPAGGPAVRFNRNRMAVTSSPVGGRTAFSIALVFRADQSERRRHGGDMDQFQQSHGEQRGGRAHLQTQCHTGRRTLRLKM